MEYFIEEKNYEYISSDPWSVFVEFYFLADSSSMLVSVYNPSNTLYLGGFLVEESDSVDTYDKIIKALRHYFGFVMDDISDDQCFFETNIRSKYTKVQKIDDGGTTKTLLLLELT